MTVGAGDAPFDRDGTAAGDVVAGETPASPGEPSSATQTDGKVVHAPRPPSAAPAWLNGEATLPWPPREAASVEPAAPAPPTPRPKLPPRTVPGPPPRPRIVEEPGILGLSRLTRGRFGSRLFTLFFVLVFTLIAVQMIVAILNPR